MNMKLNVLVLAAVASFSVSGAANAAYANAASGNSSLFLTVLDNDNNISALFDLGKSYSTFSAAAQSAPGTSYAWNVASGDYASAWTTFLATADLSKSKFAVYAGDRSTDNTAGSQGFITTYSSGDTAFRHVALAGTFANTERYLDANVNLGNHATVEDGASTATVGNAFAETWMYKTNGKVGDGGNLVATGLIGSSLDVISVVRSGASPAGNSTITVYGNEFGKSKFTFDATGLLTYSTGAPVVVVPEPESYAMMVAGLGLMGFMARRRKNSK